MTTGGERKREKDESKMKEELYCREKGIKKRKGGGEVK